MKELLRQVACIICKALSDKPAPTIINGAYEDLPSSSGIIPWEDVKVEDSIVTIIANGKVYKGVPSDTNSMDGIYGFDKGHTPLLEKVSPDLIKIGDIVVVWDGARNIIHRVVEVGFDAMRFFRTQGDHPDAEVDPFIFRDEHILYRCFGWVYTEEKEVGG